MLKDVPAVALRPGVTVAGLLHDAARNRVTGVRTDAGDLAADLVVDVSGTASHMGKWLAALPAPSNAQPEETVVPSPWQYVSQWWHLPPETAPDWACLSIAPQHGDPARAGMILRAERACWNVVLLAGAGREIPTGTAAFLREAADLGEGEIARALAPGAPLTPVHAYGRTANRLRHWGRLDALPDGLAILGDAAMTLDPYRGLGMTAVSISVQLLADMLKSGGVTQFRTCVFQRDLAELQAWPWRVVTGCDAGGQPDVRLRREFERLHGLAPFRPEVARAVFECHHLVRPLNKLPGEANQ
jgi:2-polyprenyl-6-methoxyphenol hydroxylase-like FAD-dependent oxidoreductase